VTKEGFPLIAFGEPVSCFDMQGEDPPECRLLFERQAREQDIVVNITYSNQMSGKEQRMMCKYEEPINITCT
jgi:hypothetical protein